MRKPKKTMENAQKVWYHDEDCHNDTIVQLNL